MHPSTALARVLADELVRHGVHEVVLAPGSRSAPLAFALHDAATDGRLRLHVRIDERSAGFLALGLIKGSRRQSPVAVVTTSGTAVANLHPAVLEASHAGLPLIVITADRPPELRGVGANQTADQVAVFGSAVRLMTDLAVPRREVGQVRYWRDVVLRACVAAGGTRTNDPGPVHLNVGLTEPLVPDRDDDWVESLDGLGARRAVDAGRSATLTELIAGPRTVVLAGDGAGCDARWLAEIAGWPLLAEPSSGARSGPNAIAPYRLLLDTPDLGKAIERVVVYGHPTLSRPVSRLLARDDVELVVVAEHARWPDPARRARTVLTQVGPPGGAASPLPGTHRIEQRGVPTLAGRADPDSWLTRWLDAAARAGEAIDGVLAAAPLSGQSVARDVAARVLPGGLFFVGSSNPIRDLDLTMAPYQHPLPSDDETHEVRVLANRGLAGIDGTVSGAVGAALSWQYRAGRQEGRQVWRREQETPAYALLGDLTFLHDSNGLVIGPDEARPNLVLVVLNDDGGGIFSTLEPGAAEHAASFERIFGTPHGVDLASLCTASRTGHELVRTTTELAAALSRAGGRRAEGISVIEARVERSSRRDLEQQLAVAVAAALA